MGIYSINKLPFDILKLTASKVALLRKDKDWTQLDLAEKSDVSYGSIKRFERTGQISFESLLKIVEAFGRLHEFETILKPNEDSERLKRLFES